MVLDQMTGMYCMTTPIPLILALVQLKRLLEQFSENVESQLMGGPRPTGPFQSNIKIGVPNGHPNGIES